MSQKRQSLSQQEYERIKAFLGTDAETFKRTKLGQYILDRCAVEAENATNELKVADPRDHENIQRLQNVIWKNESFELFLDDAIHSGHLAMDNLTRMEESEDENNQPSYYSESPGESFTPPELPGE